MRHKVKKRVMSYVKINNRNFQVYEDPTMI